MDRRHFLLTAGSAPLALAPFGQVAAAPSGRLLVLIDLLGGNDGLNTLIPFGQPAYYRLRPTIAMDRSALLPVASGFGLHPALRPLMPLWQDGQLALLQGVGCPAGSLSHHRATEIMDSGRLDDSPLQPGWLARCLAVHETARHAATPALVVSSDMPGPLHGLPRCRSLSCADGETLAARFGFPADALGDALARACAELAGGADATAIRVALDGFDTHEDQPTTHARLLDSLARSLAALRNALTAMGRWQDTLVMTRSEFGRLAHENLSAGTDHGNAGVQLVAGGRVDGGLRGAPADLDALDARGGLPATLDVRTLQAAVAEQWLGVSAAALGADLPPLPFALVG